MSTIREVIERVDGIKPNAFSDEQKVIWLAMLDGKIAADLFLMSISDIQTVLNPITERYFGKEDANLHLADIYNEVFGMEYQETKDVMKELSKKFTNAEETELYTFISGG